MKESTRTLAYFCPDCRQAVIFERSIFELTAASGQLPCPCGKSALRIELDEARARLSVPCLACGRAHTVTCSTRALLEEKVLALSCAATGLDCCYIGEEGPVFAAMKRLEGAADKLGTDGENQGAFLDETVMFEVLSELKDIARRENGISCTCGSHRWQMQINFSSIDLTCADCGGVMRIPAATADDLDDICCKYRLIIRGGKGRSNGRVL